MTCYYPMQALKLDSTTASGKQQIRFVSNETAKQFSSHLGLLTLPCGQCVGCRLERSRQWAIRCEKEIQDVEDRGGANCFITLTFNDESLLKRDNPMSLDKRDFQLFMKRFRKACKGIAAYDKPGGGVHFPIRYYQCGEYGELFKRPHYHAIIFNYDFPDKKLWRMSNGQALYTSSLLNELWPYGFSSIGNATFDSAAYVARYIMKKHLGKDAWKNYFEYIDEETGELVGHRIPEYTTMSRRSGIGKEWLDKYLADVYSGGKDKIFVRGKMQSCKPPRYYDSQYEIIAPQEYLKLKQARIEAASQHKDDQTPERLDVRQKVLLAKTKVLVRPLE